MIRSKTDIEVLIKLQEGFSGKIKDIAKELNKPYTTVVDSVKRLLKEKIIEKFIPKINFNKIGVNFYVLIFDNLNLKEINEIKRIIQSKDYIFFSISSGNRFLIIICGDEVELNNFLSEIPNSLKEKCNLLLSSSNVEIFSPKIPKSYLERKFEKIPNIRKKI